MTYSESDEKESSILPDTKYRSSRVIAPRNHEGLDTATRLCRNSIWAWELCFLTGNSGIAILSIPRLTPRLQWLPTRNYLESTKIGSVYWWYPHKAAYLSTLGSYWSRWCYLKLRRCSSVTVYRRRRPKEGSMPSNPRCKPVNPLSSSRWPEESISNLYKAAQVIEDGYPNKAMLLFA
jgi:hypothetical protein